MKSIYIKTKIYSGENSLKHLEQFKDTSIWIICDGFLVKNGSLNSLLSFIHSSNKVSIFDEVVPDPPLNVIGKGVAISKQVNPQVIVAYGGGSAIDTAKAIIYFAKEKNFIAKVNFIAIPTTSGTGSEVTSATVITDTETKTKHIIFDDCMLPDEAILDANLTVSVPSVITANTGIDVLTHAIEAYVAKGANVYSDALAEKAVELVMDSLIKCYREGDNLEARGKMHEASNIAGMAFNISGLGINHSIAHQIGGRFHVPHGLANALLLTAVIDYNSKDSQILKKYAKLAYKTGMVEKIQTDEFAVEVLKTYIKSIKSIMKMPVNLKECGVDKYEFDKAKAQMSKAAFKDGCTSANPREVSEFEIEMILESVY